MILATISSFNADRFFDALSVASLQIDGLYTGAFVNLVTDPQATDDEIKACQQFVDAFDFSDQAQAAWEAGKQKAAAVAEMLADPKIKTLIDYLHGEIKVAVPAYVVPDTAKLEADLTATVKVEVKP